MMEWSIKRHNTQPQQQNRQHNGRPSNRNHNSNPHTIKNRNQTQHNKNKDDAVSGRRGGRPVRCLYFIFLLKRYPVPRRAAEREWQPGLPQPFCSCRIVSCRVCPPWSRLAACVCVCVCVRASVSVPLLLPSFFPLLVLFILKLCYQYGPDRQAGRPTGRNTHTHTHTNTDGLCLDYCAG